MVNQLKRNFLWNAAGNLIYLGCQWLITVLVTRICGYEDAGVLSLAMSIGATFNTIAAFGIRNYQVSDIHGKYKNESYAGFRLITCVAAFAICAGFSAVNQYGLSQFAAIMWFMLFRIAECYSDMLHGVAQKNDRLDIAGKALSVKGVVILAAFLAGYYAGKSLNVGLAAMALSSWATTLAFDLPQVQKIAKFKLYDKLKSCIRLGGETVPLCVYQFLVTAIQTIPKYFLERISGETALGAYSSIFAPALLIQAAAGYIYTPLVTKFAQLHGGSEYKKFNLLALKTTAIIALFGVAAVILCALGGELVMVLIFGESIREHVYLLIPIVICVFLIALMNFYCVLEIVLRDYLGLLISVGAGVIVCLLITTKMIETMGTNGTSYGLAISVGVVIASCVINIFRKESTYGRAKK